MTSILDQPDVEVTAWLSDGSWDVGIPGGRFHIRPWTWGERRRLIDACVGADGRLDADAFAHGLSSLVARPEPTASNRPLLAAIALRLLGVSPGQEPISLLDAEASLASAWGFGPFELDPQPAPRLDQHVARLPATATPDGAPAGWTSIVIDDGS